MVSFKLIHQLPDVPVANNVNNPNSWGNNYNYNAGIGGTNGNNNVKEEEPALHIRYLTFPDTTSWHMLAAKIESLFFIPLYNVAVVYTDEEGDKITISTHEEFECFKSSRVYRHDTNKLDIKDLKVIRDVVRPIASSPFGAYNNTYVAPYIPPPMPMSPYIPPVTDRNRRTRRARSYSRSPSPRPPVVTIIPRPGSPAPILQPTAVVIDGRSCRSVSRSPTRRSRSVTRSRSRSTMTHVSRVSMSPSRRHRSRTPSPIQHGLFGPRSPVYCYSPPMRACQMPVHSPPLPPSSFPPSPAHSMDTPVSLIPKSFVSTPRRSRSPSLMSLRDDLALPQPDAASQTSLSGSTKQDNDTTQAKGLTILLQILGSGQSIEEYLSARKD